MSYSLTFAQELLDEAMDGVADVETDMRLAMKPTIGILSPNGDAAKIVSPIIEMMPHGIAIHFDKETRVYLSYISAAMLGDTLSSSSFEVLGAPIEETA